MFNNSIMIIKNILKGTCTVSGEVTLQFSPRGYKTFFMLNSVEYEILNAHKYKNIFRLR